MIRCELCSSSDMVKVITKKQDKIGICRECCSVYELDKNEYPVMGHDPEDYEYFKKWAEKFDTWDDAEIIEPYNEE